MIIFIIIILLTLQDSTSHSVAKYTLKMNKDGKDYEEKIDVDTENETETFHVPKTSSDNEAADIVYDFKKVIHYYCSYSRSL